MWFWSGSSCAISPRKTKWIKFSDILRAQMVALLPPIAALLPPRGGPIAPIAPLMLQCIRDQYRLIAPLLPPGGGASAIECPLCVECLLRALLALSASFVVPRRTTNSRKFPMGQ